MDTWGGAKWPHMVEPNQIFLNQNSSQGKKILWRQLVYGSHSQYSTAKKILAEKKNRKEKEEKFAFTFTFTFHPLTKVTARPTIIKKNSLDKAKSTLKQRKQVHLPQVMIK